MASLRNESAANLFPPALQGAGGDLRRRHNVKTASQTRGSAFGEDLYIVITVSVLGGVDLIRFEQV